MVLFLLSAGEKKEDIGRILREEKRKERIEQKGEREPREEERDREKRGDCILMTKDCDQYES